MKSLKNYKGGFAHFNVYDYDKHIRLIYKRLDLFIVRAKKDSLVTGFYDLRVVQSTRSAL